LQRTALQSQQAGSPFGTAHYPIGCIQGLEDVTTFSVGHAKYAGGFGERLAKGILGDLKTVT
jgi:hypothetical protein